MEATSMNARQFAMYRAELQRGELEWWYLSFATHERFLGGIVLRAFGIADAVTQAHMRKLNPGGQVLCALIDEQYLPPSEFHNRLLTEEEIKRAFPELEV
jgi:hypothetical protein